jgi:hypothetical protein
VAAAQDDLTDYVPRHPCVLPPLTSEQVIIPAGTTATCPGCGNAWVVLWVRDQGGETQPQWVTDTTAPAAGATAVPFLTRLDTVTARVVTEHRAVPLVAAIALGKTLDVAVTWLAPFPDANYTVEAIPTGLLIGKVTAAVKPGSQTTTGAVITLTATAVVVAGSSLDVTAVRLG